MADWIREYADESDEEFDMLICGHAQIISLIRGRSLSTTCAVFPAISQVALGWSDGAVEIRDIKTFEETIRVKTNVYYGETTFLSSFTERNDENLLLSSFSTGDSMIWNVETGIKSFHVKEERESYVNGFSCDRTKLAIGGSDAKINIYDVETQTPIQILQKSILTPEVRDGHSERVVALHFHPLESNQIISGGWDNTIQFWDIRESFSKRYIYGPHIRGNSISFLDSRKFVTASWRKQSPIEIWDYESNKLLEVFKPDNYISHLYCCDYIESDSILLTGGINENMLKVVQMNTSTTLCTFRDLEGGVQFVKVLPKQDPSSVKHTHNICFCASKTVYLAEIEV